MKQKENFQKEYVKANIQVLILITLAVGFFCVFYFINNITPLNYMLDFVFIMHLLVFITYAVYRFDYNFIYNAIPLYIIFLEISLVPIAIFFWKESRITPFLFFLLIPLYCLSFGLKKIIIFVTSFMFITAGSVFLFAGFFNWNFEISNKELTIINVASVMMCFFFALVLVWNYKKFNSQTDLDELIIPEKADKQMKVEEEYKLKLLYTEILKYLEIEQPYRRTDFNIIQLADRMNSNISYISKAIKLGAGMNFSSLINEYRISLIVSMLNSGQLSNYTMAHIYSEAGFSHQSTFNATFLRIMGMTPSEYILSQKKKEQD